MHLLQNKIDDIQYSYVLDLWLVNFKYYRDHPLAITSTCTEIDSPVQKDLVYILLFSSADGLIWLVNLNLG